MAHFSTSFSETVSVVDSALHFHRNIVALGEGTSALSNRTLIDGLEFGNPVSGAAFVEFGGELHFAYMYNRRFIIYEEYNIARDRLDHEGGVYEFHNTAQVSLGLTASDHNPLSPQNIIRYVRRGNVVSRNVDTNDTPQILFQTAEGYNAIDLANLQNGEVFALVSEDKIWVQGTGYSPQYYDFTVPNNLEICSVTNIGNRIVFGLAATDSNVAQIRSIDYDFRTRKFYNPLTLTTGAQREPRLAYYNNKIYSIEGGNLYRYDIGTSVLAMSDSVASDKGKKQSLLETVSAEDSLSTQVERTSSQDKTLTETMSISESLLGTASTPNSKSLAESLTSGDGIIQYFRHEITLPEGAEKLENRAVLTGNALNSSPASIAYHKSSGRIIVGYSTTGATDTIYQYDYNKTTGVLSEERQVTTDADLPESLEGMVIIGNTILVVDRTVRTDNKIWAMDYDSSSNAITNIRPLANNTNTSVARSLGLFQENTLVVSDAAADKLSILTLDLANNSISHRFDISMSGLHSGNEVIRAITSSGNRLIFADTADDNIYSGELDLHNQLLLDVKILVPTGTFVSQGFILAGTKLLLLNSNPNNIVSWDYTPQSAPTDEVSTVFGIQKALSESSSISDAVTTTSGPLKTLAENLGITAVLSLSTNLTQQLTQTLAETVNVSDAITRAKGKAHSLIESLSVSDALITLTKHTRNLVESASITTALSVQSLGEIVLNETMSIADALSRGLKQAFSESLTSASAAIGYDKHYTTLPEGMEKLSDNAILTGDAINDRRSSIAYHSSGKLLVGYSNIGNNAVIYTYDYDISAGTLSNGTDITPSSFAPSSVVGMTFVGNTLYLADNVSTDEIYAVDYNPTN